MPTFISSLLIKILSGYSLEVIVVLIHSILVKRVPESVQQRISELVAKVDDLDLPGEEKFKQVYAQLRDENSPMREIVRSIPMQSILHLIQDIYEQYRRA